MLRRVLEAKGLSPEPMKQLLSELKLPKDAVLQILTQTLLTHLEETKEAVYRSVSRELREVLDRTNVADEIAAALSKLSVEVTMQVQFKQKGNETNKTEEE